MSDFKWYHAVLAVVVNSIWVIPFLKELVYEPIRQHIESNKEFKQWKKEHPNAIKKQCLDCKYCRWFWARTFYSEKYRNCLVVKTPKYCKKAKKHLSYNPSLRCVIKNYKYAEWEETE